MTSIKKSILQLKQDEIDREGKYELYKEYNDKILMDSLYVKDDNIENYNSYENLTLKKRKIPSNICNIENEYKCNNILKDFNKLQNKNNNDIKNIDNKLNEEITKDYIDYNKKYLELKKHMKIMRYFNIFLFLLMILIIIIIITNKI